MSINHRQQTEWAIKDVQYDGVSWGIQGTFLLIVTGQDSSPHEPLVFRAWAFSWKENERSPQTLWIPGVCEVGLGTSPSPRCKSFLAREGLWTFSIQTQVFWNLQRGSQARSKWGQWLLSSCSEQRPCSQGEQEGPCAKAAAGWTWAWLAGKEPVRRALPHTSVCQQEVILH